MYVNNNNNALASFLSLPFIECTVCLVTFKLFLIIISKDSLYLKLMEGKVLRKHSLHEKTAASVLFKPFISSNE